MSFPKITVIYFILLRKKKHRKLFAKVKMLKDAHSFPFICGDAENLRSNFGFTQSLCLFQLRTRNSIRGFVRPSFGPSVFWSVRPSVGLFILIESKFEKYLIVNTHFWCCSHDCLCEWARDGGMDEGCMPLPNRLQRYREPALIVIRIHHSMKSAKMWWKQF